MAEELAGGGEQAWSRMSGYPSGRSVMTECMVERFSRSPREWEDAFKNRDNRAKMLTEILAVESSSSSSAKQAGKAKADNKGRDGGKSGAAGLGLAPSPFNAQAAPPLPTTTPVVTSPSSSDCCLLQKCSSTYLINNTGIIFIQNGCHILRESC